MNKEQKRLLIRQLDDRINRFSDVSHTSIPNSGWVYAIRNALGMSLSQLGERLGMTAQGAKAIEQREADDSITIDSLKQAAHALDMRLVYGFIPNEGSLEKLIEKRARALAQKIVMRTSHTMTLEDQGLAPSELEKAIDDKTKDIIYEMPKYLWD
ncbi:MAG: mobile mystery protein A [Bacteroidota bacterium]